jgi:hypothetical protein
MAGALVAEARGGRRSVDFDVNMIPMIDLLMVTISFLLLTAVWTHSARVPADAQAPGTSGPTPPAETARLHVEMGDAQRFLLHWDMGPTVVRTAEVPRHDGAAGASGAHGKDEALRFPELAAALEAEWRAQGTHRAASDGAFDDLVLHVPNDAPYAAIVGAMDAAYAVKRRCGRAACGAFHVVLATH